MREGMPAQRGVRRVVRGSIGQAGLFFAAQAALFVSFGQAKEMKGLTKLHLSKSLIRSQKF